MSGDFKIFSEKLRQALTEKKIPLKQDTVAKALKCSPASAWHYLNGMRFPRFSKLKDIASILEVDIQFLINSDQSSSPSLVLADFNDFVNESLVVVPIVNTLALKHKNNAIKHGFYYSQSMTISRQYLCAVLGPVDWVDQILLIYNHPSSQSFFQPLEWVFATSCIQIEKGLYLFRIKNKIIYKKIDDTNFTYLEDNRTNVLFQFKLKMSNCTL